MNHYTSYSVSKALWDAGIVKANPSAYYDDETKELYESSDELLLCCGFPAYTLGELVRELPLGVFPVKTSSKWWVVKDMFDGLKPMSEVAEASTPEDAVGLALIELKKGENDVQ